jgi:hypothetical protein
MAGGGRRAGGGERRWGRTGSWRRWGSGEVEAKTKPLAFFFPLFASGCANLFVFVVDSGGGGGKVSVWQKKNWQHIFSPHLPVSGGGGGLPSSFLAAGGGGRSSDGGGEVGVCTAAAWGWRVRALGGGSARDGRGGWGGRASYLFHGGRQNEFSPPLFFFFFLFRRRCARHGLLRKRRQNKDCREVGGGSDVWFVWERKGGREGGRKILLFPPFLSLPSPLTNKPNAWMRPPAVVEAFPFSVCWESRGCMTTTK